MRLWGGWPKGDKPGISWDLLEGQGPESGQGSSLGEAFAGRPGIGFCLGLALGASFGSLKGAHVLFWKNWSIFMRTGVGVHL